MSVLCTKPQLRCKQL